MKEKLLKRSKYLFALLTLIIIGVVFAVKINGQATTPGLILSPPYLSKDVKAGESYTQEFSLNNRTGISDTFIIESREIAFDENGQPFIPKDQGADSRSTLEKNGWLTITPKSLTLNDGEKQNFTVTLNMPRNQPTNGYYSEIAIFGTAQETLPLEGGAGSTIKSEVAIPLAINLLGDVPAVKKLEIVSFEIDKPWYDFTPVKFISKLLNTGNVHLVPSGQIFIGQDQEFKNNLDSLEFNASQQLVYNKAGRIFENVWNNEAIRYDDKGSLVVDWGNLSNIRFGQYYAQLNVIWDTNQGREFVSAMVSFWIIPWQLILMTLIILIILFVLARRRFRKNKKVVQKD